MTGRKAVGNSNMEGGFTHRQRKGEHEIKRKLNCPHVEKISANSRFFYFDDYVVEEK